MLLACSLAPCLALTGAVAAPPWAGSSSPARPTAGRLLAERSAAVLIAPPARIRARRATLGGAGSGERFTATPSTLPAAGGSVDLHARVVRNALSCRFSSARSLRRLPSVRDCTSGSASVTVRVPRNSSSSRRRYILRLTVSGPHGTHRTLTDVIVQRSRVGGTSPGNTGETAASGVRTPSQSSSPSTLSQTAGAGAPSGETAPTITAQPASGSVAVGSPVTLTASAAGNPVPSGRWEVSVDGGTTWTPTDPSFLASASENGNEYREVFTNAAGSATTTIVTITVPPTATTSFSGYIDYAAAGQSFTAVSASWIVPAVTCSPGATTWAAQWPGIGDETTVQQDGTETDCLDGTPSYWAWYEMYGDPAVNNGYAVQLPSSSYPVNQGDSMTGSVSVSGSIWTLTIADATQNWTFSVQISATGLSQASAEWLVEDPDGCSPQCQTLSRFTPVPFSGATATANGQTGPISSFPATAMQLVQNSTVLASPGPLDASGGGFTDSSLAG